MRDAENIAAVSALLPDYIGFIFYPQSKRYAGITGSNGVFDVPAVSNEDIKRTGVFVNESIDNILEKIRTWRLKAVQLHGEETPETCRRLQLEGVEVIKAFGIHPSFNFEVLTNYADSCDYFLFDTYTELRGGSGKVFDWKVLQRYSLDKPYFLSGGISLENIEEIKNLTDARLYAVDLNSKFEVEPALKNVQELDKAFKLIKNTNV